MLSKEEAGGHSPSLAEAGVGHHLPGLGGFRFRALEHSRWFDYSFEYIYAGHGELYPPFYVLFFFKKDFQNSLYYSFCTTWEPF